jgi:hypothetical protein
MVEVELGSFSSASLSENNFDYSHQKSEKCGKRKHNQRRHLETSSQGKGPTLSSFSAVLTSCRSWMSSFLNRLKRIYDIEIKYSQNTYLFDDTPSNEHKICGE